jgi:hypothetical protein
MVLTGRFMPTQVRSRLIVCQVWERPPGVLACLLAPASILVSRLNLGLIPHLPHTMVSCLSPRERPAVNTRHTPRHSKESTPTSGVPVPLRSVHLSFACCPRLVSAPRLTSHLHLAVASRHVCLDSRLAAQSWPRHTPSQYHGLISAFAPRLISASAPRLCSFLTASSAVAGASFLESELHLLVVSPLPLLVCRYSSSRMQLLSSVTAVSAPVMTCSLFLPVRCPDREFHRFSPSLSSPLVCPQSGLPSHCPHWTSLDCLC